MKSITKEAKELLKRRDLLKSSIFSNLSNTEELNNLSEKLEIYKNGIKKAKEDKESEEHCKNILKDFLNGAFKYNCNTKGKIDLTIKYEGNIKAIIETKNYDNKTEMIKDNDYYYKSFYQSVLYYYQSRKNINKDMTVEHIIITDFENIYLFLRSDFEYLTANKQIINFFNVKKIDTNTKDFYNSSKAILEKINREVVGYKINLFEDDAEIIFKFLSPYNICSLKTNNDFNIISNTFYREIIYMMGLEETKDKKLVLNKVDNTLIKLTMDILDEDLKGEEKFETALKLNILWINRILFLKILEAQLRVFRDDNNLHILNYNEIVDYSFLYTLFFKVLAKSKERRITENKENEYYKHIPYLNSSLFEETEEEKINSITKLNNSLKMKIMSGSVLYKDRDFDKKELNFLEYILRFLNCYIFNAINDSSNINKNTIIKSSILGLVFERLNGYKDGSHFTPPAITMYMAKYSIEKSIVSKFNKFFKDANFKNVDEIKIYVDANIHKIKEQVKYILDSITIIDPACGSGHFLVACLNELIKIKSYLHVLSNDIKVDIEDDELVINYINGTEYKYNMESGNISEIKQKIQKILFEAKKHIINNQLYGVDINPNSVNICRLRLWIELLKSSYYLENNGADKYIDLEILPNLEFKVLSANSLIELEEKEGNNNLKLAYDKTELVKNMREYFNADFETKKEIRKKVLKLLKEYSQYNTKLKDYNPFDMLKSYDFFDSEIMFGIDSFDIVIGNPPYVSNKEIKNKDMVNYKKLYGIQDDLYYYFYIKGIKLLEDKGILSYISSNSFLTIQSKKGLRELLQGKHLLEIINTGNVFEHAEVEPAIVTLINEDINNYEFNYSDNTKEDNPVSENNSIKINVDIFINSPNSIFFTPNEFNMRLYNKFVKEASVLISQKWDLIKTSRDIEKNQSALQNYRNSLKEGDITLLGLITEGGQGLATANNGKYVGIIENTKDAERVYNQRLEKIKYFNKEYNTNYDISKMKEKEIRELFDLLKEKHGRDIFGQGFIYRIVSKNEIADINNLSKDEKENGIENKKSFVPYDKGDKEGNKWYSPTVFAIDWNSNNVKFLKENSGKKGEGMPVFRNPQFYFKEGFSWNNVLNPNSEYIKARYKEISINDVASMSLYSLYENTSSKYFLVLLNSYFLFYYLRIFINNTVNLQINDVRQLPIIIPNKKQLKQAEILFDRGKDIKEKRINNLISEEQEQKELKSLQEEVDGFVCELYDLSE